MRQKSNVSWSFRSFSFNGATNFEKFEMTRWNTLQTPEENLNSDCVISFLESQIAVVDFIASSIHYDWDE